MTKNKIHELAYKFKDKPYMIEMGKGKLANWLGVTEEVIVQARAIAKNLIQYGTEYNPDVTENVFKTNFPKILIFDIETSPSITYTWGRFKQNIALSQVAQDPIMLTWSAKWLYNPEIMSDKVTKEEVLKFDDFRIVASLWDLLDEADIAVAHFGDYFDIPFMQSRAIINGFKPFSTIKSIDTKRVAASQFRFPSNKLDALGTYFGLGNKIETTFDLWKGCLAGNQESINKMSKYNDQDVILLEEVYLKLRPYIRSHPNIGIYIESDRTICSCCGSGNLINERGKFFYTQTTKYPIFRCMDCGGLTRGRKTVLDKIVKKTLGTGIPR